MLPFLRSLFYEFTVKFHCKLKPRPIFGPLVAGDAVGVYPEIIMDQSINLLRSIYIYFAVAVVDNVNLIEL